MKLPLFTICVVAIGLVRNVVAYGSLGHLLTAQIAQDYLSEDSKKAIADILSPSTAGKIERIASWADYVKTRYRWSSSLHYINPPDDPPTQCEFKWVFGHRDIVNAIFNYTVRLGDVRLPKDQREEALKFLVHFLGDMHNPLHLTGRSRGGNSAAAIFDHKKTSLHRIWDSQILAKQSRELETSYLSHLLNLTRTFFLPNIGTWIKCPLPIDPAYSLLASLNAGSPVPTCPDAWATEIHQLNCAYVWADYDPHTDLAQGLYWDRLNKDLVEEKLIVMGGVRIAAVLNGVFGRDKSPEPGELRVTFESGGIVAGLVETMKSLVIQAGGLR